MADWTAITGITGIVVSGVVGPGLGARYASRRMEREHDYARVADDRAEAREILDSATQHLQRCGRLRTALHPLFMQHGTWLAERAAEHVALFHEAARAVDLDGARLELRFGTGSDIVSAHLDAFRALEASAKAIGDAAVLGADASLRDMQAGLNDSRDAFNAAELRYMAAAHQLAAAQLQPAPPRGVFGR